jgi:hypothetical protein
MLQKRPVSLPTRIIAAAIYPGDRGLPPVARLELFDALAHTLSALAPMFVLDSSPPHPISDEALACARFRSGGTEMYFRDGRPPVLTESVHRFAQALTIQISQSVMCNRLHAMEERICRWLLMAHDRAGTDEIALTQHFIAEMLGIRRPSVTVAAGMLQKAGLIGYSRGNVTVLDRAGLEEGACECYGVVNRELEGLMRCREVPDFRA